MALLDNVFEGNAVTGLALGAAVVVLGPVVLPAALAVGKPLAKAMVKGGLMIYDRGREMVAEAGEVVEDIVAEARSEMQPAAAPKGGKSA